MRSDQELCKPRMVVALDHKRYINRDMTAMEDSLEREKKKSNDVEEKNKKLF